MWQYLLIIVIPLVLWKYFIFKRPLKYPPGPTFRLPIFKQLFYYYGDKIETLEKLRKRYGDVYSMEMQSGGEIVISELSIMRKLLNKDVFSLRQQSVLPHKIRQVWQEIQGGQVNQGLLASSGDNWKEQRRFTLKHLKGFGFGKASMELSIMDEVKDLSETWKSELRSSYDDELRIDGETFNMSILNALWGIVSGQRFNLNDNNQIEMFRIMNEFVAIAGTISIKLILSLVLPLPFRTWMGHYQKMKNCHQLFFDWFQKEYEEHLKTYDEYTLRDYVDCYICERKKAEEENSIQSSFYGEKGHWNFVSTMFDLFSAGEETTSSTLQWAIAYFIHYPEVQKRAQEELDEIVGRSRLPALDDLDHMPYIEALLSEIQRCGNIAPFSVKHAVSEDIEIEGYLYTKNSTIIPNLSAILNDPKNFEDPESFNPDRFLCKETGKFVPHPALIVFGVGKRECLGKNLAKKELYLFLAGLLHQFCFYASNQGPPDLKMANISTTRTPKPFRVKVIPRML